MDEKEERMEERQTSLFESDSVAITATENAVDPSATENVLRRHVEEDPRKALLTQHKLWLNSIRHEYPMPHIPYKIGVYIRFFNQTKHENYLDKHIQQFTEDIALCPKWTLVDFYIDYGSSAPGMTSSKEWCRLLDDCAAGKVDLIVTQKASNISKDPYDLAFVSRALATQKRPVGIYCISEDIFTLASYYWEDMRDDGFLPADWERLPDDELDEIETLPLKATLSEGSARMAKGVNSKEGEETCNAGTE